MYACMYVCMYVCMHVCMYVCVYVCMYALCMYVCMHVCVWVYVCIYVCIMYYVCISYVYMYVCMCVCMYVCGCMYVYTYIYICIIYYVCMHYVYMYVCMYALCIYMYVCMYVCMYACMYVCACMYICVVTDDPGSKPDQKYARRRDSKITFGIIRNKLGLKVKEFCFVYNILVLRAVADFKVIGIEFVTVYHANVGGMLLARVTNISPLCLPGKRTFYAPFGIQRTESCLCLIRTEVVKLAHAGFVDFLADTSECEEVETESVTIILRCILLIKIIRVPDTNN